MKRFIIFLLSATTLLGSGLNVNIAPQAIDILKKQWVQLRDRWEEVFKFEDGCHLHYPSNAVLEFQVVVSSLNDAMSAQSKSSEARHIKRLKNDVDIFVIANDVIRWATRPINVLKKQWDELCDGWRAVMNTQGFPGFMRPITENLRNSNACKIIEFQAVVNTLSDAMEFAQSAYSAEAKQMKQLKTDIDAFIANEDIARWA